MTTRTITTKGRRVTRKDFRYTTRLWAKCPGCGCKWQWSGKTHDVVGGLRTIEHSACFCPGEKWERP